MATGCRLVTKEVIYKLNEKTCYCKVSLRFRVRIIMDNVFYPCLYDSRLNLFRSINFSIIRNQNIFKDKTIVPRYSFGNRPYIILNIIDNFYKKTSASNPNKRIPNVLRRYNFLSIFYSYTS